MSQRNLPPFFNPDTTNAAELKRALAESEQKYSRLFESMSEGFLHLELTRDKAGGPVSFRFLDANPVMERLTHLKRDHIIGKNVHDVLPNIEPYWTEAFERVAATGEPETIEQFSKDLDGWYRVYAHRTSPDTVALMYSNVTDQKKTQQELEKTWRELESLAINAPDVIGRMDRNLRHLFINRVITGYTGLTPKEYIGKTNEELGYPPELCRSWNTFYRKVFETGEPREIEFSIQSTKGVMHLQSRAAPEFGSDGTVESVIFATSDVTKLKQAEESLRESEERFRIMADGTPVMIWATNPDGTIEFVNRAWCDFFGVTAQQVITNGWAPLVHPDDAGTYVSEYSRALKKKREFRAEARVKRYDGQWRWVMSRGRPRFTDSGEFLGIVGSSPDITEQKKAEEMLRDFNETLEKRVVERTREVLLQADQLRALASRLRDVEQRERKRLAKLVHDRIQQHVVAAQMRLESVKREMSSGALRDTSAALRAILSDIVEASRNLVSELSPQALQKAGLIGGLDWLARNLREQHDFSVRFDYSEDAEPSSEGLQLLIYDFVRELLLNTVKHADTREADVTLTRSGNSEVQVTVRDNGKGFDPQVLGSGFGLFGIQERLAHIGGSMDIESSPGEGTRITLTIPDPRDDFPAEA